MYSNQSQQLPANPEQLQFQYVDPGQVPGPPQIPELQQVPIEEAGNLHYNLVAMIQETVNKGPVRIFMFNLYAAQGFNNRMYVELYAKALEYYIYLRTTGRGDVRQAADQTLKAEIPNLLQQFPPLQQYLSDQQRHDLQQFVQLNQQIANEMRAFVQSQQQGGWGQPNPQQQGWGNPNAGWGGAPAGGPPGGGWGAPPGGGFGGPPGGGHRPGPSMQFGGGGYGGPSGGPGGRPGGGGYPGAGHPGAGYHGGGGRPGVGGWGGAPGGPAGGGRSRPVGHRGGGAGPATGMLSNQGGPAGENPTRNTGRPSVGSAEPTTSTSAARGDEMKYVDPTDRQLGHLMAVQEAKEPAPPIDRQLEFISHRFVPAHYPHQRVVVTQGENGPQYNVEDSDMDYEEHEGNPNMIRLARSNTVGPKVQSRRDWDEVSVPSEVSSEDTGTSEEDAKAIKPEDPVIYKDVIPAYSLEQARMKALEGLEKIGIEGDADRVFEYYTEQMTYIGGQTEADQIEQLRQCKELSEFVGAFAELAEEMEPRLWYRLHDKFTEIFNARLKAGIASKLVIESISDDYDDVLGIFRTEGDEEQLTPQVEDKFKRNVLIHILRTLNLRDVNGKMYLAEPISVTELPWSSEEIDLVLQSKCAMLSSAVNSHMLAAAQRVYARTNVSGYEMSRRLMTTVDNVTIELHHGDLGKDTLLISKV